ncbi:tryptophan synthase subunit alpha [Anaerosinus massiliensis]|uniref:tryptophan synthase subunit alpha n=1 Tax=Massilibacillus massiliensis TaxID=1806837 RepID=UPI000AFA46A3|nr:tryptophan synthase subunit alpha [Massilibacillus massiliensis]
MTRLNKTLSALRKANKKALFIYITAGAPDFETTMEAVKAAEKNGADVIEIGIPFSDPIADGPVIQEASVIALQNGATMKKVLALIENLRKVTQIPLVGMGYINTILTYGIEKFVADFKAAGLDGMIVPDLPHEESEEMRAICKASAFHLIEFVTPTTISARIKETCQSADGFIYCVSVNGVTGVREIDYGVINDVAKMVRKETDVPLAVGFGIGSPEAAIAASEVADAVIVGSAVVKCIVKKDMDGAANLIADIRKALDERE